MKKKDCFEEVNVELALELLGGYEQVYKKLIESFLTNQEHLVDDIKKNLLTNRIEARRLVHSCKGISKNIGAMSLYDITKDFEVAIIEEEEALIEKYMQEFEQVYTKVISELKSIEFN